MKFYISYFAQFRNMSAKQICFSTAAWDPKWFHDFQPQAHRFVKDGRVYGLRMPYFICNDNSCSGMPCPDDPETCKFLKAYAAHLDTLDFNQIYTALTSTAKIIAEELNVEDPDVVLLVHEAPTNPCSERNALVKWFNKHHVKMTEWKKDH